MLAKVKNVDWQDWYIYLLRTTVANGKLNAACSVLPENIVLKLITDVTIRRHS